MKELDGFKKDKGRRIEDYFLQDRDKILELEKKALKKYPRLNFLDNILTQSFKMINKNNPDNYLYNPSGQSVLDFILKQGWMNISSTEH